MSVYLILIEIKAENRLPLAKRLWNKTLKYEFGGWWRFQDTYQYQSHLVARLDLKDFILRHFRLLFKTLMLINPQTFLIVVASNFNKSILMMRSFDSNLMIYKMFSARFLDKRAAGWPEWITDCLEGISNHLEDNFHLDSSKEREREREMHLNRK